MRWIPGALVIALPLAATAGTDEYENKKALAYLKVGSQRQEAGNCKDAVSAFKRGIEHRQLPELLLHLGQCHRTLGDGAAAATAFRAYLKAAPNAPDRAEIERYLAGDESATAAPPSATKPAPSKPGAAPPPPDDSAERDPFSEPATPRATVEKCQPGMVKSGATGGHCCWPEQVWAGGGKGPGAGQCIGTPACPRGFKLQAQGSQKTCVRVDPTLIRRDGTCPPGREISEDHCCWPEQEWLDGACSGRPSCPDGYRRKGEDCIPEEQ